MFYFWFLDLIKVSKVSDPNTTLTLIKSAPIIGIEIDGKITRRVEPELISRWEGWDR